MILNRGIKKVPTVKSVNIKTQKKVNEVVGPTISKNKEPPEVPTVQFRGRAEVVTTIQ